MSELYGDKPRNELTEDEKEEAGALVEYLNDFPIFSASTNGLPNYEMVRQLSLGNHAGFTTATP